MKNRFGIFNLFFDEDFWELFKNIYFYKNTIKHCPEKIFYFKDYFIDIFDQSSIGCILLIFV